MRERQRERSIMPCPLPGFAHAVIRKRQPLVVEYRIDKPALALCGENRGCIEGVCVHGRRVEMRLVYTCPKVCVVERLK